MATYAENLITLRDNVVARLAEMSVNPKPNYSIDGESMSWGSLFDSLTQQLAKINELIAMSDGGYEIKTQVFT